MFHVEARGVRLKSMFCVYGKEWESPLGDEPCVFEDEETARIFFNNCVDDDKSAGVTCHAWRLRRDGEAVGYMMWKPH